MNERTSLRTFLRRLKPSVYRHPGYVALHVFLPGRIGFIWRDQTTHTRWAVNVGDVVFKRNWNG